MRPKKLQKNGNRLDAILAEAQRDREKRTAGYRDQALKIFPHICARCGREFTGRRLRELTVHHKDHDHDNNPPDGSNWELLCIYCHDMEHARYVNDDWDDGEMPDSEREPTSTYKPFAALKDLLKDKK